MQRVVWFKVQACISESLVLKIRWRGGNERGQQYRSCDVEQQGYGWIAFDMRSVVMLCWLRRYLR